MSFNIGVINAAVTLDDSEYRSKLEGLEQSSASAFKKIEENVQNAASLDDSSFRAKLSELETLSAETFRRIAQQARSELAAAISMPSGLGTATDAGTTATGGPAATEGLGIDSAAADGMREFFASAAEAAQQFRAELESATAALKQIENGATGAAEAGTRNGEVMRLGTQRAAELVAAQRNLAAAQKELAAAQKEMDSAASKADAAGAAAYEADNRAAQIKRELASAQQELKAVEDALTASHHWQSGDVVELSERENELRAKVQELQEAFEKAQADADKFGAKLDESAGKADAARAKLQGLKAQVDEARKAQQELSAQMSASPTNPLGGAEKSAAAFAKQARTAGTQATALAQGFNAIGAAAGAAVPGVSRLGSAIGMFGRVHPAIAATTLALGAVVAAVNLYRRSLETAAEASRRLAELAREQAAEAREQASANQSMMDRLVELNGREELYNSEKRESLSLVNELNRAIPALAMQYDAATGKVTNLADANARLNQINKEQIKFAQEQALKRARENAAELTDPLATNIAINEYSKLVTFGKGNDAFMEMLSKIESAPNEDVRRKRIDDALKGLLQTQKEHSTIEFFSGGIFQQAIDHLLKVRAAWQEVWKLQEQNKEEAQEVVQKQNEALADLTEKEWKIKFSVSAPEEQIRMLEARIEALLQRTRYASAEELKAADRSALNEAEIAALSTILDLERQRADANKRIADERERAAKAREQAAEALRKTREANEWRNTDDAGRAQILDRKIAEKQAELDKLTEGQEESEWSKEALELANELENLKQQRAEISKRSDEALKREEEARRSYEDQRRERSEQKELNRELEEARKSGDPDAAAEIMDRERKTAVLRARVYAEEYEKALKDAQADGVIDAEEQARIAKAREKWQKAQDDADRWDDALSQERRRAEEDRKSGDVIGTWSAAELASMLGKSGPEKETAENTREMVRLQREANRKATTSTSLTYGS